MSILRFYGHFAAAYGTCMIVIMMPVIFAASGFWLYGFFALALAYAVLRTQSEGAAENSRN